MASIEKLTREELLKLLRVYAKNWLAHDGCWFLAAEEAFGIETAMELDKQSWNRFAVSEAQRIMNAFEIPPNGGLHALQKAFEFRLYAAINRQQIEWIDKKSLIFKMVECWVQKARRQKNLPEFPCKSVGLIEFEQFAKTVDSRIKTECISCPPDPVEDCYCAWKFVLE